MAWVSAKVYAILKNSEEGKDIIERLPDLTQDECDELVDEFFSTEGKGSSSGEDYIKAKEDDEFEKMAYDSMKKEDADEEEHDNTREKILERKRKTNDAFTMPENEGWKQGDSGEKSFIKNEGKDNEMFIQYNGEGVHGIPEYVAGYMKNGEYITEKFDNLEDAKDFIDNADVDDELVKKNS